MVNKIKRGGKMIATGSNSCILKPNLNCKDKKKQKISEKKISKIVFGKKSKEYTEREKDIDDIIKKIPGHKDWSLIFDELCKPPSFDDAKKMDKGLYDCLGESSIELHQNKNSKKRDLFDKNSIMLVGDYGGETLEYYFEEQLEDETNIKNIETKFLDIMEKIDKIFLGLVELKRNEISHLDIKPNNIVLSDNNFKFIDFGLSGKYSNLKHFKKRAINEANTSRIYIWYPGEFLFSQSSKSELKELQKKLEVKDFEDFRNHANTYKSIYSFFDRNAKRSFINILNNYLDDEWTPDFNKLITKVDVYGMGMLMPVLFYNNDLLERVKESEMLQNFFSLFSLMTAPLYIYRIDIENAYILYKGLLEKFGVKTTNIKKGGGKKKTKKKSKSKFSKKK